MANKADARNGKKITGGRQEKVHVDEMLFRHVDQMERWRQEFDHQQAIEKRLLDISNLSYEAVDYLPQLERTIFQEKEIPDFSYLLEEARVAEEAKFFLPVIGHVGLLIFFVLLLIITNHSILLWVSGTGVVTMLTLLFVLIDKRNKSISKVIMETNKNIENRIEYEKNKIEEEKKQHEQKEDERIKIIEDLVRGDVSSVLAKIENVLSSVPFYFNLSVEIELYKKIPGIKVWLPSKSLIPTQICTLAPSGRPSYEEKNMRTINRQYLELCAGIIMKIMSVIYSHIPTFEIAYIYGMTKESQGIECLFACKMDRETLVEACNAASGLAALQRLNATFSCDTSLELLPIHDDLPEEWGKVIKQLMRSVQVNISK